MNAYTPTPWHCADKNSGDESTVYASDGECVAQYAERANVERIVECVNGYDAIVAALKWAADEAAVCAAASTADSMKSRVVNLHKRLRAELAKGAA